MVVLIIVRILPLVPGLQGPAAEVARGAGAEIVGGSELVEKVQCLLQHILPFSQILTLCICIASHCVCGVVCVLDVPFVVDLELCTFVQILPFKLNFAT